MPCVANLGYICQILVLLINSLRCYEMEKREIVRWKLPEIDDGCVTSDSVLSTIARTLHNLLV